MDRIVISLCLVCLVVVPLAGNAQHVYKCVDGRDTSYQSVPCEHGKHLAKQWEAAPEPALTPAQIARQRDVEAQGERESQYLRSLARRGTGSRRPRPAGVTISAARDGDRCAKAKKRRDDTERRQGLDRTFQSMQRQSKLVSEACR